MLGLIALAVASFPSVAVAQQRISPLRRQLPQIPFTPLMNPQAAPVYYPGPAVNYPSAPLVYYPAAAGAPPQVAMSNRCFVGGGSFGVLGQWAPLGVGCWVSDANGNVYNGVVQ
jgi:hypothetical protein